MTKRILIIGNSHDRHLTRFVRGLRRMQVHYAIDILDVSMKQFFSESSSLYDGVYLIKRTHPSWMYKTPVLKELVKLRDTRKIFRKIAGQYEVFNIQYVTLQACLLVKYIHRTNAKLITSPWGSDVYRMPNSRRKLVQKVFNCSDYVAVMPYTKFGEDVKRMFNVQDSRCVSLCFGSDILDKLAENTISKNEAKKQFFGSSDNYVIVCGYNAAKAQNHLKIIDVLKQITIFLPSNALIVLPMTYSKNIDYMNEVKDKIEQLGIKYIILDSYLEDDEIVKLRKATDLFIHMQTTDAYSSSLHEYLLCGTTIINAEWLRYPELEQEIIPYNLASFENLSSVIIECVNKKTKINNTCLSFVLDSYKWSTQIQSWNELFTKLLYQ